MNNRIEINAKVLSVIFLIVGSTLLVQVFLRKFTELPKIVPAVIPVAAWIILLTWFFLYNRKRKEDQSDKY